jgi:hypothetical protein
MNTMTRIIKPVMWDGGWDWDRDWDRKDRWRSRCWRSRDWDRKDRWDWK